MYCKEVLKSITVCRDCGKELYEVKTYWGCIDFYCTKCQKDVYSPTSLYLYLRNNK